MTKKSKEDFQIFINKLKGGDRDIFNLIDSLESNFEIASFDELISNTDDVLSGVNRVLKHFQDLYFGIFDSCLVKYHDNGDIKFVFFTDTKNTRKIIEIASNLYATFGNGYFKEETSIPFNKVQEIFAVANGVFDSNSLDILTHWIYEDLSFLLQYRVDPLWQFSLMVTISEKIEVDRNIRRKGTILDILNFDVSFLLSQKEINKISVSDKETVKYVDYIFLTRDRILGIFDTINIRIFSPERKFTKNTQTHITLLTSDLVGYTDKIALIEKLVRIYGADNIGSEEIRISDIENLQENKFWLGRRWVFNESHGIWNSKNKDEKISYEVSIGYDEEEGFKMTISSYDKLVSLFGIE